MKKTVIKILSTILVSCSLFAIPASANTWYPLKDGYGNTSTWFLVDNNNIPITGWYQENNEWYYLDGNGIAYNSPKCYYDYSANVYVNPLELLIDGKYYYFDNNGRMIHDDNILTGIGAKRIDSNGNMHEHQEEENNFIYNSKTTDNKNDSEKYTDSKGNPIGPWDEF